MIEGKTINPAGSSRTDAGGLRPSEKKPGLINKLKGLYHTIPAAMSGDSSAVMDKYMKYRRENSGV